VTPGRHTGGMDAVLGAVLGLAALAAGMTAGLLAIFSTAVMPGLRRTDDRTFVAAFGAVDRAIPHPVFAAMYVGALVLPALAVLLGLGEGAVAAWSAAAFALYLAVVVLTARVHLPRNRQLQAAGPPEDITDPGAVRRAFDEARWTRWNTVRAALTVAATACLLVALVELGSSA
jgi:uncharacterized membrane protein